MKFIEGGGYNPKLTIDNIERVVSSVGVLVHTGLLTPQSNPSFLLVERTNNEGWSIPAGKVEDYEQIPQETAVREVGEEIDLEIKPIDLKFFLTDINPNTDNIRIVYSYSCELSRLMDLGNFTFKNEIWVTEGDPISEEITRLAIVPRFKMFQRDDPIIHDFFKWKVSHAIKARLEGLRVI